MAGARFLNQNYEGALEAIREYIRHFPEESRGYVLEGDIYRAIGNDAKATAIYCEAAEMFPEDYYSSKLALYMLLKQWDLEQMERIDASISRIMQQRPDDQWVLLETIKLLLNLKQWKPIPSIVQNYLMQRGEDDPYASLVWLYSGVAYYHMGNYQDSIKHLLRGYELGERNEVLVYLSAAYYKRGDLELAAAYAQLTCQQYPNESDYALYYEQIQQKLANSKKFLQAVFGRRNSAGITMPDKIYLDHQTVSKVCSLHFVVNGVEYIVE
ncbi:Tetratricopeptide repeat protein [compost metagenome]